MTDDLKLPSSRRALLGSALAMTALAAAPAAYADTVQSGPVGDLNDYPSAAVDRLYFPGFKHRVIETQGSMVNGVMASGATINTLIGGNGPPLLLMHGHPETHVAWHKVANTLAQRFTVVLTDLRGYGDSSKPDGGVGHVNYAKRVMADDQVQVMKALGFNQFQAVGHDRGGRVLQFMLLDHPDTVTRGVTIDIAPTDGMYGQTTEQFATRYFWWFFQIQPAPFPEQMIKHSAEFYLQAHIDVQNKTPGSITELAFSEYLRCYTSPGAIHGACEDYRAAATIDKQLMQKIGNKIQQPLMALWGAKGTVGQLFDVIPMWKKDAVNVTGAALPCGHLVMEEDPVGLLQQLTSFLKA